jgi:5-oxopent-3-ene-1,2,5-tricarboxylate decarboxylase / 2-hydroxyhepta-2,4-diene-1,7-dioate isomerase
MPVSLSFDFAPYRLSGVVYGTLMNDPQALAALGDSVHQAPYKAPPKAPVLYLKPRNTLATSGDVLCLPADSEALEVGAALGLVIGRTACRVKEDQALHYIAGYTIVNDVTLPHDSYYRPSIRFKARDGFCPIGAVVPAAVVSQPDALAVRVYIDGELVQQTSTAGRIRSVAQLLAAVTDFMTLQPGDILMLGVSAGAPRAHAGQHVAIEIDGLGRLENTVMAEEVPA